MAYYENDEEQEVIGQAVGPEVATIQGQVNTTPTDLSGSAAAPPKAPGNFAGIQQYLDKNRAQAGRVADRISAEADNKINQAQSQLQNSEGQFNQAVDQSVINLDSGLFNNARTNAESVVRDPSQAQSFKRMRDAEYAGPNSFEGSTYYQPAKTAIDSASQYARNLQTIEGREQGLKDVQGGNRYSRGNIALDSALLGLDQNANQKLSQAARSADTLGQNLREAETRAGQKATDARATTDLTRNTILGSFSGDNSVQKQLEQQLDTRAEQQRALARTAALNVNNKLKQGQQLDSSEQALVGDQYGQLQGKVGELNAFGRNNFNSKLGDFGRVLSAPEEEQLINAQNVATPEEYARYQALNELMDTSSGFLNDPSLAGKANNDFLDFNQAGAQDSLAQSLKSELAARREAELKAYDENYLKQRYQDAVNEYNSKPIQRTRSGEEAYRQGPDTIFQRLLSEDGYRPQANSRGSTLTQIAPYLANPMLALNAGALKKLF